jgi:hypothetical protein
MAKRISQLNPISSPDNADLFLLTDSSETQSKKITFSALKSSIIDSQTFAANQALLVAALNTYDPNGDGKNGLRATTVFHDGQYREGAYFLTYANLSGKPTIPSNLSQLTNSTGFVRYSTATGKMIYDGATTVQMTSDFINEGTNNLFYTNARADARVNQLFGGLFNTFNSTFDQGDVRDSLTDEPGVFIDTRVSESQSQSKTIRSTALSKRNSFSVGQVLRLYGASSAYEATTIATGLSLTTQGFLTASEGTAGYTKMSYKIAEFDIESGEISPASVEQSSSIKTPLVLGSTATLDAFNSTNFIRLNFTGAPVGKGLAVYRQVGNTGDYKLIAVLGRKEVDAGSWIDYYTYDYTSWSGKSAVDNSFTSVVHFPLTAPSGARRGWVDKTITAITDSANSFDITLDDWVFVNLPDGSGNLSVSICHNDTAIIRNAILTNSTAGKKSIVLNAKIYNTSQLTLPNNFGLVGTPYITRIKKLPWSGGEAGTENAKLIVASSTTNSTNISIVGVDIDGNFQNQFLFADSTTANKNYLLDFGVGTNSLLIDKVRITNLPAGGIWATSPIQLKINTSELVGSGLTDRYSYSPLIADAGQTTMITGNRFENFSRHIDLSVTNKGVFANNIVSNCGDEFGQGVFIYGSIFFLSSPNVLIGPAGEFLPTPDILNSEYDLINIDLYEAAASNDDYQSPSHVYQENGAVYDLTQTDGSAPSIEYRAFFISKNAQGVEEIYGTTYTPANFTVGKRYTILSLGDTTQNQWNTAAGTSGRVYAVGSSFICAAVSTGTGTATSGGVDGILINDRPAGFDKSLGQFGFDIPGATVQAIKTANGAYSNSTLKAANAQHQGIGWSASYRHEVTAATISGTGTWTVDPAGLSPTYTITTLNTQYLALNQRVRFSGSTHTNWANPSSVSEGIVVSISAEAAGQRTVVIRFPGAGGGTVQLDAAANGLIAGTSGSLNIIDTFVMAQGRII